MSVASEPVGGGTPRPEPPSLAVSAAGATGAAGSASAGRGRARESRAELPPRRAVPCPGRRPAPAAVRAASLPVCSRRAAAAAAARYPPPQTMREERGENESVSVPL